MLAILGAVAEFANDIRRERQRDGIEKAKARGAYQGRPATIDPAVIKTMRDSGAGPSAIAASLGISRASVYRVTRSERSTIPRVTELHAVRHLVGKPGR